MKRIGIVERSGRGVDKIYRGLLRFGRPKPDYGRTNDHSVIVQMSNIDADQLFLRLVVEQENARGSMLPIDSLIVLATLHEQTSWHCIFSETLHKQKEPWSNWLKLGWSRCVAAPATGAICFRLLFIKPRGRKSLTLGRLGLIVYSMNKWCWGIYAIMGAFNALT